MSDNTLDDVFDNDSEVSEEHNEGPKALRDALKKEAKKAKELQAQLDQLLANQRKSEIEKAISEAGLPAGAAKFAARDIEDLSKIGEWIEENRGLFGGAGTTPEKPAEQDVAVEPTGKPSLSDERIAELQATQGIQPGNFEPEALEARKAAMDKAVEGAPNLQAVISGINAALR